MLRGLTIVLLASTTASGQDKPEPKPPERTDEPLGERLIRKAVTGSDEDLMTGIVRLMKEATERLDMNFDTGEQTQALQRSITLRLGEAIKVAAAQRRPVRRSGESSSSDRRRMPAGRKTESSRGRTGTDGRQGAASSGTSEAGQTQGEEKAARGDLRELRQGWGHLPMRERDELIQGIGERYLERYRAWIERYYRALQETSE